MYAMQYAINLPADYDMGIIRRRVDAKGPLLDEFPGLGLKAYLIRERGTDGATVNQYAPFYLWASIAGMNRFLWGGGGFQAIIDSFGRPTVEHWTGVAFRFGPAREATPTGASRSIEPIACDADPAAVVAREMAALAERAALAEVHSTAFAIDPRGWQLVRFTLYREAPPDTAGTRYQVLHLSSPEAAALAA